MRPLIAKIKPASGFSRILYVVLNILLPLAVFVLVRMDFVQLALAVMLLSKWRMLAVRPRFWLANTRANAVDIIVGVSVLILMVNSGSQLLQFVLTLAYIGWLLFIKPASTTLMVSVQALVGLLAGLMAIYLGWADGPLYGLVFTTGLVCYLTARHFFDSFDEPYAKLLSFVWGYFGAALIWVLGHWLLFYGAIAQPVLLLLAIGYGLAALYYLDHHDRLSKGIQRQIVAITIAVVVIVVVFSDWGNKIIQ